MCGPACCARVLLQHPRGDTADGKRAGVRRRRRCALHPRAHRPGARCVFAGPARVYFTRGELRVACETSLVRIPARSEPSLCHGAFFAECPLPARSRRPARCPLTHACSGRNQASAAHISSHVQQLAPLYARFLSEFDRSLAAAGALLVGFQAPACDRWSAVDAFVEPIRHIETYRSIVKILVSRARVTCLFANAAPD